MKRILLTIFCAMTMVLAFTSCNDKNGNDYTATWGIQNIAQVFEGTPEHVDSLTQISDNIMVVVDSIYDTEMMNIDTEKSLRMLVFRNTTANDVKARIQEATDKAEATLRSINTPFSMDGLYFEFQISMKGLTTDDEEVIYTTSFGDKSLLH